MSCRAASSSSWISCSIRSRSSATPIMWRQGQPSSGSSCTTHIQMPTTWMPDDLDAMDDGRKLDVPGKREFLRFMRAPLEVKNRPSRLCQQLAVDALASASTKLALSFGAEVLGHTIRQFASHRRVESLSDHIGNERRRRGGGPPGRWRRVGCAAMLPTWAGLDPATAVPGSISALVRDATLIAHLTPPHTAQVTIQASLTRLMMRLSQSIDEMLGGVRFYWLRWRRATRLPACKARSREIVAGGGRERRKPRPLWRCPWLSARDQSGPL
jgi:hypothetical protein